MKYLSKLISCYGGATISSAAEAFAPPSQQELMPEKFDGNSCGRSTKFHATSHWKPALPVISEYSVASDIRRSKDIEGTTTTKKKSNAKTKSKAEDRFLSHGDEYRKFCDTMALPAFSPTPFVF
ncbi:hypothetical protein LguiB_029787 [Lonicera macranthoides]